MDSIDREDIIATIRMQPDIIGVEIYDHYTVSDVVGLNVPDYVHKALPLREAFVLGVTPQWIDFFDGLTATYCQLISRMHKDEILSNHLHPNFLDHWYKGDSEMDSAYNVLRGISGWAVENNDDVAEAIVDITLGIPAGQTVHERKRKTHGNVVNLREFRSRAIRNANLH